MKAKGVHYIVDSRGVNFDTLNNEEFFKNLIIEGCKECNYDLREIYSYKFEPYGLTVIGVIGESHISFHTFPEEEAFMLDVFCCGDDEEKPKLFVEYALKVLEPTINKIKVVKREV